MTTFASPTLCNLAQNFERSEKPLRLPSSISVYATLIPTKVQAFYQYRLSLFATLRPSLRSGRQLTFSGLSFRDFAVAPQKICNIALAVSPQKADKGPVYLYIFFSPFKRAIILKYLLAPVLFSAQSLVP